MYVCTLYAQGVNNNCKIILKPLNAGNITIIILSVDKQNLNATIKISEEVLCLCQGAIINYDWGDIRISQIKYHSCRLAINVNNTTKIINTNKFRRDAKS